MAKPPVSPVAEPPVSPDGNLSIQVRSESFGTEVQKRLEEVESSQLASYECLVIGLLARELDIPAVLCRLKEPLTETGSPH